LWTYYGDEEHEHIVFDYTPNHARAGPAAFLSGFEGYLQADAYAGYDEIYAGGKVIEVGCWAHARRKFFEPSPAMVNGRTSRWLLSAGSTRWRSAPAMYPRKNARPFA